MALVDYIDRQLRLRVAGDDFVLRPISVLGMMRAQVILGAVAAEQPAGSGTDAALRRLEQAVEAGDMAEATAAISAVYLEAVDGLGRGRFAELLGLLVVEAPDGRRPAKEQIERLLEADPAGASRAFIEAAAALHDLPRLLRAFIPREPAVLPAHVADSEGIGLETVMVDVVAELHGAYGFSDILDWPYERLLSVQDQICNLRALRAGRAARREAEGPRAAAASELATSGISVSVRPRRRPPVH